MTFNLFGKLFYLGAQGSVLVWADWKRPVGTFNKKNAFLNKVEKELMEYLSGKRKTFSFKMDPAGTPFQKKVWKELLSIPWGKTVSYSELAHAVDSPLGVRAVASAVGRNPIAVFIPCHRVVSKDGSIGGYSGGLPTKIKLLDLEGHSY